MKRHKHSAREMRAFGIGNSHRVDVAKSEQKKGFLVTPMKVRTPESVVNEYSPELY